MNGRAGALAMILAATVAVAADGPQAQVDSERDLRLELTLRSSDQFRPGQVQPGQIQPGQVQPGQAIDLGLELVNGAKDRPYRIVMPGDGSGWNWREPHVFITAETETLHDYWEPLAPRTVSRCKQFDRDWLDEVRTLDEQQRVTLDGTWMAVHRRFDLQQAGRVRLTAHYAYDGREVDGKGLGPLAGVEPFELKSNPIIVTIVRPLEIETLFKGTLTPGAPVEVAELCKAYVQNQSEKPITIDPAAWRLTLAWRVDGDNGQATVVGAPGKSRDAVTIEPGGMVPLFGKGGLADAPEGRLAAPADATVEVWAELWSMQSGGPHIRSRRSRPKMVTQPGRQGDESR